MITVVPSQQRNFIDRGWMKSYRTFSFQDYYDDENNDFGKLVVFNEEIFAPGKGFNLHPTSEVEILTYVVDGELEHFDDFSNKSSVVNEGEFQLLGTGKGVNHSEKNSSKEKPLRYLQFWFTPCNIEQDPSYQKIKIEQDYSNKMLKVLSKNTDSISKIRQDIDFYIAKLDKAKDLIHKPEEGRKTFIYLLKGHMEVNDHIILEGDSIRISDDRKITIKSIGKSEFFLIDIK